jgi:diguanylate cyclase (GGDEF)-like protein
MSDAQKTSQRLLAVIKTQTDIAKLGLDLGGVMALVTERAQEFTAAAGAVVELAEGSDMVYRAVSGIAAGQLGLRLKRDTSLSGMCVNEGRSLRCDDSETDDRVDREACRRVGLRSMVVVPLVHDKQAVGALKVMGREPGCFDDKDMETLNLMSDLIAAAMYHATQHSQSELFHRATHDGLTGLANRALFYDRLRQSLAQAERVSGQLAVLNLDMDGLKPINDTHGHKAGDEAIKALAERISEGSRDTDTVARVGGDEFAMVLVPVDGRPGVATRAERIGAQIARPYTFDGKPLELGASIGWSVYPDDGKDVGALVEKADAAMYAVKKTRKNTR